MGKETLVKVICIGTKDWPHKIAVVKKFSRRDDDAGTWVDVRLQPGSDTDQSNLEDVVLRGNERVTKAWRATHAVVAGGGRLNSADDRRLNVEMECRTCRRNMRSRNARLQPVLNAVCEHPEVYETNPGVFQVTLTELATRLRRS